MLVRVSLLIIVYLAIISCGDKPCLKRYMPGQSVVCVCNATYCDETVREAPMGNSYVTYTSSEAGSRFKKSSSDFQKIGSSRFDNCNLTLSLDPNTKYQKVEGFGGAVTDSAAINWLNLTDSRLKQNLIDSYFSARGLQYNMLRVPIGGSDFSTHPYAYNEHPMYDEHLSNYSLSYEDYNYKIPMIRAIMKTAVTKINLVATCWSPPIWMKTNKEYGGTSMLKEKYYQTYANYHLRFLELYARKGIPVWAITTTNEPINGVIDMVEFNSLGWSPLKQGQWIADHLGPTIRNSCYSDVKILAGDDQRASVPWYWAMMVATTPEVLDYVDGLAVHFYTDQVIPADILSLVYGHYPDKFILSTEACEGALTWDKDKVLLGSWDRAKNYVHDIIEDLNFNVVGWIDWNLCLDKQGGPNWVENYVDSPIIVFPEKKEFLKQPMFYVLGHFSKFLPRGSQRIKVTTNKPTSVENVAFVTPQNTVVVILYNDGKPTNVSIKLDGKLAQVQMEARSVVTVELPLH